MESTSASLTVFFEDPFWVAVYQRMECGRLRAAKVVFGKEPKECEIYAYFLNHWGKLRFGPPSGSPGPQGPWQKPQACAEAGKGAAANQRGGHQGPAGGESPAGGGETEPPFGPQNQDRRGKATAFCPAATEEKGKTQRAVTAGPRGDGPQGSFLLYAADLLWVFAFPKAPPGLCCPSTARGNLARGNLQRGCPLEGDLCYTKEKTVPHSGCILTKTTSSGSPPAQPPKRRAFP